MTDETQNNHQRVRAKVVTIRNTGGARWEVEFEGVVTRRDIHRINRILNVEFARAQRRYSTQRKKLIRETEAADRKAEQVERVEKTPVVIQPDEIIVPTKTSMTPKKVTTKETIQNG